jgi:hypothetical protein
LRAGQLILTPLEFGTRHAEKEGIEQWR